ncbi:hypothetical protein BLA29_012309, partial [Euroglyphus maynei]
MTLIIDYLNRLGICDSFVLIRKYILNREIRSQQHRHQVDVKSIIRILNHLVDIGRVRLLHYGFNYKENYRNSYYVIHQDDGQNQQLDPKLVQHLILRSRFAWFARYPIDLDDN